LVVRADAVTLHAVGADEQPIADGHLSESQQVRLRGVDRQRVDDDITVRAVGVLQKGVCDLSTGLPDPEKCVSVG